MLQDISGVTHHLQSTNRVMRQEQSRLCTISRPWRGAKADRGLEMPGRASPKTTEPLLVSPPKATTGVRWASLGGSIAAAATCKWRAWSTNSLAPLGSCVSQSLNTCSFCLLRLGVDGGSLHAQTQSPPLLSDWSLFDGTWIAVNLPVRYKRPGCRSGTSTFSSVRKLRLWLPLRLTSVVHSFESNSFTFAIHFAQACLFLPPFAFSRQFIETNL